MPFTNEQLYALVNKPDPEEIVRFDLVNKPYPDELKHFGILGMKWGIRRFQNEDGTLTEAGKKRYLNNDGNPNEEGLKAARKHKSLADEFNRRAVEKEKQREKEREEYLKKHKDPKTESGADLINSARNTTISNQKIKDLMKEKGVDYDEVYMEMADKYSEFKNLLDSEDPDDYRDAEKAWYLSQTTKTKESKSDEGNASKKEFEKYLDDNFGDEDITKDFKDAFNKYTKGADGDLESLRDTFYDNLDKEWSKRSKETEKIEKDAWKHVDDFCKKQTGKTYDELEDEAYNGQHKDYDKVWETLEFADYEFQDYMDEHKPDMSDLYNAYDSYQMLCDMINSK